MLNLNSYLDHPESPAGPAVSLLNAALGSLIAKATPVESPARESERLDALSENDLRHLEAARRWMMLGRRLEANEELENITRLIRSHAAVKL